MRISASSPERRHRASKSAMALRIDGSRCDGHGICVLRCPERIALDKWGYAVVDLDPIDEPTVISRAVRAVNACPEGALELVSVQVEATNPRAVPTVPLRERL